MTQDPNKTPQEEFLKQTKVPYTKDKASVWRELEQKIQTTPIKQLRPWWQQKGIGAAAAILLMVGASFLRFYSQEIQSMPGQLLNVELPDGSIAQLNAASSLSYHPYWWWSKRSLHLKGEAFFKVKKGSDFTVESELGTTTVLGTTFNIYSRAARYEVFCKSGRVQVSTQQATTKEAVILTANEQVQLIDKKLKKQTLANSTKVLGWLEQKIYFEQASLVEVLEVLERQYAVQLDYSSKALNDISYGGFINKKDSIEVFWTILQAQYPQLNISKIDQQHYSIDTN